MSSMREAVATKLDGITRYHDHMKQKRFGFLVRPAVLIIGWFVVIIGIIAIPLPGPGWLIVFIGVAILSLELHWATRLLSWGIREYEHVTAWYASRSRAFRYSFATTSFVFVWAIVGLTAYVVWRMGGFSMLDPVMHAVM